MLNQQIANIFRNIAQILEIKGENLFRIRAYLKAADNLENITEDLEDIEREGRLTEMDGIGKDLAAKISEFIGFDKIKYYEELKKTVPEGILDLLIIPGIGPKTARLLYDKFKISDIVTLEKYAREGKLHSTFGLKQKTEENILRAIDLVKKGKERMDLGTAYLTSDKFIRALKNNPYVKKISAAGSLRRMKETVRDIDILVVSSNPKKVMDAFVKIEDVKRVLSEGQTKSSVITKDGFQVDLRVVSNGSFGAALLYFTGSKAHNIELRQLAIKKGLKINEYGVFKTQSTFGKAQPTSGKTESTSGKAQPTSSKAQAISGKKEKSIAGNSEEEVYKLLGMSYIEPELRETSGEIEAALRHNLPDLVQIDDIKADLHVHSTYSDGHGSIKDMALAAEARGYEYIALTDHSISLKVANGLDLKALNKKRKEIDKLNRELKIKILFGTEVELDKDGNCDYSDKVLSSFDIVVGAIHSGFKQPKEKVTKRLIRACGNKHIDIIAHPTGRLWGVRNAYEVDFTSFFKAAAETGTFLEISAFPTRLDLNDINSRRAVDCGVKLVISTDAHYIQQLDYIRFGVAIARRAWLKKSDVLNTVSLNDFMKQRKK